MPALVKSYPNPQQTVCSISLCCYQNWPACSGKAAHESIVPLRELVTVVWDLCIGLVFWKVALSSLCKATSFISK